MKLFLVILTFLSLHISAQRDTLKINNDWKFQISKDSIEVPKSLNFKKLITSENVSVPHTWNVKDATQHHYGFAWYQKSLSIPKNFKNKKIKLVFGAVNHTSYIFLNGKKVGENIGDGFNKFEVDLTNDLSSSENILTVLVNNDYGKNKIPYSNSFDWPNDGGIIREVYLVATDKNGANKIFAEPKLNPENNSATLGLGIHFDQPQKEVQFEISLTENNQKTKNTIFKKTIAPNWKGNSAETNINLEKINPWHFDFPNLYLVSVKVLKNKKIIDEITTNIGFRKTEFKDGKFYLNNEPVKLIGVEWTAGSNPDIGFAESKKDIYENVKRMKEVNSIFTRIHFPQDDEFYHWCDKLGILVQSEIPLWGGETPATESINQLAKNQLDKMIFNLYNHPSIFSWGVGNELQGRNAEMKNLIEKWIQYAKNLDETRSVTYVSNTITHSFSEDAGFTPDAGSFGDYISMNEYAGSWWEIPEAELGKYLDKVQKTYSDKPFFISEFGLCEPNFKGGDERRIKDMIYHFGVYESKDYINGAIYFDLTDYRTHYPGTKVEGRYRQRIHGVYDAYGNPKPSMKVLRDLSSPLEIHQVHQWNKGKLTVTIFGSKGLPEHIVRGYKIYLSSTESDYKNYKSFDLPEIKPGEKIHFEVEDLLNGEGIITITKPNGFVVTQKSFYSTKR